MLGTHAIRQTEYGNELKWAVNTGYACYLEEALVDGEKHYQIDSLTRIHNHHTRNVTAFACLLTLWHLYIRMF